jgi:hypothetical protein
MAKAASKKNAKESASKSSPGMTFAEFGERFFHLVVTEDLIEKSLAGALRPDIEIDEKDPKVTGNGTVTLGRVTERRSSQPERELVFEAPLSIRLKLYVEIKIGVRLGQENFEISADVPLRLFVHAVEELAIHIDVPNVKPDDVKLIAESKGNWLDLAKKFGDLENKLKTKIAEQINSKVEGSAEMRTKDVLAEVKRGMGGGGPPGDPQKGKDKAKQKQPGALLTRGGEPMMATLSSGQSSNFALPAGDAESFDVDIYSRKKSKSDDDGELSVVVLDQEGGKLTSWGVIVDESGDAWTTSSQTIWSSELGSEQTFIRIINTPLTGATTPKIDFKIRVK